VTAWQSPSEPLAGRLVTVEPLEERHEPGLWAAAGDPEVWRWMTTSAGAGRSEFRAWLDAALDAGRTGEQMPFAILDARDGAPVGSSRYLTLRPEHRGLEIGFTWMARSAWGTGMNTESKLLLLAYAFERLGCMRVEFKTEALNARSRAALAALPAQFEGVFATHMLVRDGEVRDSAWYSVVDDDWPDVRRALEARVEAAYARRERSSGRPSASAP
jgi:RimJ/RimL family protein N-acetyltransferase